VQRDGQDGGSAAGQGQTGRARAGDHARAAGHRACRVRQQRGHAEACYQPRHANVQPADQGQARRHEDNPQDQPGTSRTGVTQGHPVRNTRALASPPTPGQPPREQPGAGDRRRQPCGQRRYPGRQGRRRRGCRRDCRGRSPRADRPYQTGEVAAVGDRVLAGGCLGQRPDDGADRSRNVLIDQLRCQASADLRHAANDDVSPERTDGEVVASLRASARRGRRGPRGGGSSRGAGGGQAGYARQRGSESYRYRGWSGHTHHTILADLSSTIAHMT